MDEYSAKLSNLLTIVQQAPDIRVRSQLYKLYTNCRRQFDALSRESVECRRLKKTTAQYTQTEEKLQECIHNFEQWVFFAKLLY